MPTPCADDPCKGNGKCTTEDDTNFKCECTGGYTGQDCSTGNIFIIQCQYIMVIISL